MGSTAGWAPPCRFTRSRLTAGQPPTVANLIMYPERGLNYSTRPLGEGSTYLVFKELRKWGYTLPPNELVEYLQSLFAGKPQ